MNGIDVDLGYAMLKDKDISAYSEKVRKIHEEMHDDNSKEEYIGWLNLPINFDKEEFDRIKSVAEKVKKNTDIFVVIGIGGSYLGARAVIESLTPNFNNLFDKEIRKTPQIIFVGNNMNTNYINDVIDLIGNRDVSINVISKSGTTTEPAIAFRIFRELLETKYGLAEAKERIFITTDKEKGALRKIAEEEDYETFSIPNDIGGRYSVLTAVGLLPIAVAGIDIEKLMFGARIAEEKYNESALKYNECYKYAVARNLMYKNKKRLELLVTYEPRLQYFAEWWKQLFAESEGKEEKGLFTAAAQFTTDLHSLGQYIQEGEKILFETVISIKHLENEIKIPYDEENIDGLNYIAGKDIDFVNKKAMEGTVKAHVDGNVPNILLKVEILNEETIGYLIYFFELACAMSGKLLEVNPFNQPGVERYKKNMFELLGKE